MEKITSNKHMRGNHMQKKRLTISSRKTRSMTGEISPVRILHIDPVLLQGLAKVGFCILLRRLNRQLLLFPPASLAFDDVYTAAEGFQQSRDRIMEFPHCILSDCSYCGRSRRLFSIYIHVRQAGTLTALPVVLDTQRPSDLLASGKDACLIPSAKQSKYVLVTEERQKYQGLLSSTSGAGFEDSQASQLRAAAVLLSALRRVCRSARPIIALEERLDCIVQGALARQWEAQKACCSLGARVEPSINHSIERLHSMPFRCLCAARVFPKAAPGAVALGDITRTEHYSPDNLPPSVPLHRGESGALELD